MAIARTSVDATEAFHWITAEVKVRNVWRVRLGAFFLKLAARCLKCGVTINEA